LTAQNGESIGISVADPCGQCKLTLNENDISQKNFSKAAVFFITGAVSLMLTGWGFTGNSTKAKDLRVTNQTKAFQVVNAEIVGDELKLTLRNISEKSSKSELDHHQEENDWTYIGTSKEGVKLSYSPKRVVKRGRLIQAWFKDEHPDSDQKISSSISLHEFNCPKGTYRLLQGTLFFRDGSARSSNQPSAWEHPLPNSVAEMEFRQVCRKTSSRKNDVR
jgi:hypothetical protein